MLNDLLQRSYLKAYFRKILVYVKKDKKSSCLRYQLFS